MKAIRFDTEENAKAECVRLTGLFREKLTELGFQDYSEPIEQEDGTWLIPIITEGALDCSGTVSGEESIPEE
tara:strand:+ start:261 stop:476 length:216 start_codon:yes stop_codon:yes gene_type:complete